jgi:glycosyltransferase involved in cell wall biosynthesis
MALDPVEGNSSKPPLLTIGLGAYNNAHFLRGAIESILAQTFTDFELVISDNASTDDTAGIIREYALKDNRIRSIRQPQNIGLIRNFNFLRRQASSEFFMWAACDDRFSQDFVETIIQGMKKDPLVILGFSPFQLVDEDGNALGEPKHNDFSGSNVVIRLLRYFYRYDDNMVYGIYRLGAIRDIDFPIWWFRNACSPYNTGFAFLAYVMARGDFRLYGNHPLFFKCIKKFEHFQPFKQQNQNLQFLFFFLLRKINVAWVQFVNIGQGSNFLLAIIMIPILALRIVLDSAILVRNVIRKQIH